MGGIIVPGLDEVSGKHGGTVFAPQRESSVFDAGDPTLTDSPSTDQQGAPRRIGRAPDIGAVELNLADFDRDGFLDAADIGSLTANIGTASKQYDVNLDGQVDFDDIVE